jgi:hypothetical protein
MFKGDKMTPEEYVQKLIELSDKKLERLKEILALTEQQSRIISEDSADEINNLIAQKQKQIDMIDELDNSFEIYYSRLKSVLGVESIEDIRMSQISGSAELKQIVTVIFNTAKQIQKLEVENKNRVQEIVNKLAGDIRRIKQAKTANNGYNIAGKLPQPAYFFDKKK